MPLYPEQTGSIWLHDLAPTFSGDTLDLDTVDVTFAIADKGGNIIMDVDDATKVDTSFRLLFTVPDAPGRYTVLTRATSGTAVYREVSHFYVDAVTDDTP
jgi:hypothetical protein